MVATNFISGLVSTLDWANVIDQLMAIEQKRVDAVDESQTKYENKLSSWQTFNTKLLTLKTVAEDLKESDTFNVFTTSLSSSSTTEASELMTASTTEDALPGTHTIEMTASSQIARTRQVSSQSYSSKTTALGLSGEIVINGTAISITGTDDLTDIQDKINNANSGDDATRVTATILSVSTTDNRLILTSDDTGEDVFSILDASTTDVLQSLGFTNSSTSIKNATSDGAKSDEFSSSETAIASLLGLDTTLSSTTVQVGGNNITINLDSDSLQSIATTIDALSGISASVVSTTTDGVETFQLDISGTTSFSDDNNILEALGVLEGGQSNVAHVLTSDTANTTNGVTYVTSGTAFDGFYNTTVGITDTITISGYTNSGVAITTTDFDIYSGSYKTVSDLLTEIESLYSAKGETVTATVVNGKIRVTDVTTGDSQLSLSLVCKNEGSGSNLNLGTLSAINTGGTVGYKRETQAGQDAKIKVDGVTITSDSNTIDDAISGVTLDLLKIESGSTLTLMVSRDWDTIKTSIQNFVSSYNEINSYINEQFHYDDDTETAGTLMGDGTLSTVQLRLKSIIYDEILGLPTTLNALSLIGITSDKDGTLSVNDDELTDSLTSNFLGTKRIFIGEGSATDGDVTFIDYTKDTKAGTYAVNIITVATQAEETGEKDLSAAMSQDETIAITESYSGRVATIALSNGDDIDDIVNAINSELDTEYTQSLVGDVANNAGASPITSTTKWTEINGTSGWTNGDRFTFSGTKKNGLSVSGEYSISDTLTDTVGGLLSAIETAYQNEVRATINTSGYIVLTDVAAGDSQLSLSDIGEPSGRSLDFGTLSTSNGVVGRDAIPITAYNSSNYLELTHDYYGDDYGFTISQVSDPGSTNKEIIIGSQANTKTSAAGGGNITSATKWGEINTGGDANDITNGAIISYTGTKHDGTTVSDSYEISDKAVDDVQGLLTDIEGAFGVTAGSATVDANGKILITDSTTGASQVAISFSYDSNCGSLSLGTFASTNTGLANGTYTGVDVAGTIGNESATGNGQILTGDSGNDNTDGLVTKVTATSTGGQGDVKLTLGVAAQMYNELDFVTDPYDGYVTARMDGIDNVIDDLQDQIEAMEVRLEMQRQRLVNQFVAMEQALSAIKNISNWLSQQISSLSSMWGL
ncbi:MAG: flagellar filament capping protein FliD [Pseudomonadota bacterium]